MSDLVIKPSGGVKGEVVLPGDKSISHRSVLFASIADGDTTINGFLTGEDTLNTARAVQSLGITVDGLGSSHLVVRGKGLDGLSEPASVLDLGNSGTGMRLIAGLLAGQDFFSILTGDQYLRKRPMARIVEPLRMMGAAIEGRSGGRLAPLAIRGGGRRTKAIDFNGPVASAQVKSALLLAGLYADGVTTVQEPSKSRDHTERMFSFFGVDIRVEGTKVSVKGRQALRPKGVVEIPADISSAAFFMVAACIVPGSDLLIRNVGVNPTRTGVIDVLSAMGADIALESRREQAGEPVADIRVRYRKLRATEVSGEVIPRAIDEIPVLSVAAAFAEGTTVIRDAAELRVKESDRIATMAAELAKTGVLVRELPDGMEITGRDRLKGAVCESHGDHRIAMSMAIAGLAADNETVIRDAAWIDTSFPGFERLLRQSAY
ncbi:MAG: 3-phosphoshikimate 1-carboxyvinyltransferase [Nitrospirae bacterium GWC2_57_9]|nr:MAG: 3-phosphoshikimate 1-carboxyvinyltransferase [Nitrospirae bacterium GWC2_57_9]